MDDWSFWSPLGKIFLDFLYSFILVSFLLRFLDSVDPDYCFCLITSLKDVGGLFVNIDQIHQEALSWGRILRQLQVSLNFFTEIFENFSEEVLSKEMLNVNQSKNKGRPWSFGELGLLFLQHLLDRFEHWSSLKAVVEVSNEDLVDVVVVVFPGVGPPDWLGHFTIHRIILNWGMLGLFTTLR